MISSELWTDDFWSYLQLLLTTNSAVAIENTAVTEDYQLLFMWCQNRYLLFDHKHWPLSPQVSKDKLQSPTQLHSSRKKCLPWPIIFVKYTVVKNHSKELTSLSFTKDNEKKEGINESFFYAQQQKPQKEIFKC